MSSSRGSSRYQPLFNKAISDQVQSVYDLGILTLDVEVVAVPDSALEEHSDGVRQLVVSLLAEGGK